MPSEQLLYHSFTRGNGPARDQQALQILESILIHGLLITPEITLWKTKPMAPPITVVQKRVCFTAIEEKDLVEHAKIFGDLSLAFLRQDLEATGATPVFYVSRTLEQPSVAQNIGSFYIERIFKMQMVFDQLHRAKANFEIDGVAINTFDLSMFTRYLTGLFYPLEDVEDGKNRLYFAQKEWRILGNLLIGKQPLSFKPTEDQRDAICSINPGFFARKLQFPTGEFPIVDLSMLVPSIAGVPVRQAIRHIVAPKRLHAPVLAMLKKHGVALEVRLLRARKRFWMFG